MANSEMQVRTDIWAAGDVVSYFDPGERGVVSCLSNVSPFWGQLWDSAVAWSTWTTPA